VAHRCRDGPADFVEVVHPGRLAGEQDATHEPAAIEQSAAPDRHVPDAVRPARHDHGQLGVLDAHHVRRLRAEHAARLLRHRGEHLRRRGLAGH